MKKNKKYCSEETAENYKILIPEFIEGLKFYLNAFDAVAYGDLTQAIKIFFQHSQIKKIFFSFLLTGIFLCPVFCFGKVVINEVAWMGTIKLSNEWIEWIELYNDGEEEIDFSGWKIENAREKNKTLEISGKISPKGFFLICKNEIGNCDLILTGLSLHNKYNENGKLVLRDNSDNPGNIIDQTPEPNPEPDEEKWPAGNNNTKQTMERTETGWQTSLPIGGTPKATNSSGATEEPNETPQETTETESQSVPIASNYPPYAEAGPDITALTNQEILFDGSKSWDPDWNNLTFFWNFGDGATDTHQTTTHRYLYPGQYIATLLVGDGQFSDIDALTINVYDNSVIISEFCPKQGWIELFNQSEQIANLTSWRLNDFVFPANSLLAPKQYLILSPEITQLESDGQIELIYPDGSTTACLINYQEQEESGTALAFDGQEYFWTNLATPGALNIISAADLENKSYLTTNNPTIQTKPAEEKISLEKKDVFAVKTIETEKETKETETENSGERKYIASLSQAAATGGKDKSILILSIVLSASLFLIWGIIIRKKKIFH